MRYEYAIFTSMNLASVVPTAQTPQEQLFAAFRDRAMTSRSYQTLLAALDLHLSVDGQCSIVLNTPRDLLKLTDAQAAQAIRWLQATST